MAGISVGFGLKLWSWRIGGTENALRGVLVALMVYLNLRDAVQLLA